MWFWFLGCLEISLIIKTRRWGEANANDVLKVLNFAHKTLIALFDRSFPGDIFIYQDLSGNSPITLYEKSSCGAYQIKLNTADSYWCQYIYQFAHEYCHVRTNYARLNQRTKWFEESVCELASIFTLLNISDSWEVRPPLAHLKGFSESIISYVDSIISDPASQVPEDINFEEWLKGKLPYIERDQYLRCTNRAIAIKMLPLFEKYPCLWNSMTYWNAWGDASGDDIYSYFRSWLEVVPLKNKKGVTALVSMFGL